MPLADFWILGFFDLLRILCSSDYQSITEAPADRDLIALKNRANTVRSAFAKLQIPGKKKFIAPSHSGFGGSCGVIYAVYDEGGKEVQIPRRGLADDLLIWASKRLPAKRFRQWLSDAT